MSKMTAKVRVNSIVDHEFDSGKHQTLTMNPVGPSEAYPEDGSDENNTFAKFTPSGTISLYVNNPALVDQFSVGEEYYVDFTKAK